MVVSSNLLLITISSFYSYAILLSNTLHILSIYQLTPLNFFTILLYPSISVAFPMPNHLVITILYISYFLKSFFLINIGILYLLLFSSAIISEYKNKSTEQIECLFCTLSILLHTNISCSISMPYSNILLRSSSSSPAFICSSFLRFSASSVLPAFNVTAATKLSQSIL